MSFRRFSRSLSSCASSSIFLASKIGAESALGHGLLAATGLYGLSLVISVLTANYFEPVRGAWPEEYGGFALVLGFAALMVRRSVLMAAENRRLNLHLQEEVERKTQALETLLSERRELLARYNAKEQKSLDDLIDFHCAFERIHPFQDGNGRVGRLILFKECLKYGIVPFIIDEKLKPFYYRGLREWGRERGCLRETCLAAQDAFKSCLDYFRIKY